MLPFALSLIDEQQVDIDEAQVGNQDATYKSFILQRFALTGTCGSPPDVINALMKHEDYDRGFGPIGDSHFPYHKSKLSQDDYEAIDCAQAVKVVDTFLRVEEEQPPSLHALATVDNLIRLHIRGASVLFQLAADESKHHDVGGIYWHFFELVALSRDATKLTVIAGWID